MKRSEGVDAPYSMTVQIAADEDMELQFARQLYDRCVELHGRDHLQTRLLLQYVATFEKRRLAGVSTKVATPDEATDSPPCIPGTGQSFVLLPRNET